MNIQKQAYNTAVIFTIITFGVYIAILFNHATLFNIELITMNMGWY